MTIKTVDLDAVGAGVDAAVVQFTWTPGASAANGTYLASVTVMSAAGYDTSMSNNSEALSITVGEQGELPARATYLVHSYYYDTIDVSHSVGGRTFKYLARDGSKESIQLEISGEGTDWYDTDRSYPVAAGDMILWFDFWAHGEYSMQLVIGTSSDQIESKGFSEYAVVVPQGETAIFRSTESYDEDEAYDVDGREPDIRIDTDTPAQGSYSTPGDDVYVDTSGLSLGTYRFAILTDEPQATRDSYVAFGRFDVVAAHRPAYVLNITRVGTGTGQVSVNGAIHDVPFNESFIEGTMVELTAMPSDDSVFDQWYGDYGSASSTDETISVVMDATRTITVGLESENNAPAIESLTANPESVAMGTEITIGAVGVTDNGGVVIAVEFYRDSDRSGALDTDSDVRLGTGTESGNYWTWTGSTTGFDIGENRYFTLAQDEMGAWSDSVTTTSVVTDDDNDDPTIQSLSASPAELERGESLTLTAIEVVDADGTVSMVEFYRDSNTNDVLDVNDDTLLGTGTASDNDWTWAGSTAGFDVGENRYFARAQDDKGAWSETVTTTSTISPPEIEPPPGEGTPTNPWRIEELGNLLYVALDPGYWDGHIRLTKDIDLSGQVFTTALIAPETDSSDQQPDGPFFMGTFDGAGHVIRNLTIIGDPGNDCLGFFGYLGPTAVVMDLGIEDANVIGGSGETFGLGVLCGIDGGTNDGGTISRCYATGNVVGDSGSWFLGGLCGKNNYGTVEDCWTTAVVSAASNSSMVGGLTGYNDHGTISRSYAAGPVSGGSSYVGGFCGRNDGTVSASFWDKEVSGQDTSPVGEGKATAEMKDVNTFLNAGWDFVGETVNGSDDIWKMPASDYPKLTWHRVIGSIVAWGGNDHGEATPPAGTDYTEIAAHSYHSLALKSDGSIVGWGGGCVAPPAGTNYVAISAGTEYGLALTSDGSLVGWGSDASGRASPPSGTDYAAIAAGNRHGVALKSDHSLVCWGDNAVGQATPPAGTDFVAISAFGSHSLALRSDGSIVGWGSDVYGQASPPDGTDFVAVAAGGAHSLALKSDGSLVGWGRDDNGEATPPGGTDYVAISAGDDFSLALKSDGSVVGWGLNDQGQMVPPAGHHYLAIAAGGKHGLALADSNCVYTIGGTVYSDLQDPIGSGQPNVTVTVSGDAGTYETTTGEYGLWQIHNVCEDEYTVTPELPRYGFQHVTGGEPNELAPISIYVNEENEQDNQSIQFLMIETSKFLIGGAVYEDPADPIGSGLKGVIITVSGDGGTYETTTGGYGLWDINDVNEGTYTVTPTKAGYRFEHTVLGEPDGQASIEIVVSEENVPDNQSITFQAWRDHFVLHDWNGDGIVSIVGDVPSFVQCVYFGNCPDGVDTIAIGDCSDDGILSIVGDVPCFVECVYFGNCPE